jgi:hypothetical protein
MFHSCGSVRAFIPDFIEMGVDVLDPVQPRAGYERAVAKEFGDRLRSTAALTRSTSCRAVLRGGRARDAAQDRDVRTGGGYVLNLSHDVLAEVLPENLIRMAETGRTYGAIRSSAASPTRSCSRSRPSAASRAADEIGPAGDVAKRMYWQKLPRVCMNGRGKRWPD